VSPVSPASAREFTGGASTEKRPAQASAIISQTEHFLLEMGKGFLFEARQKRFTFDEDHFFVDLVFYNRLLRCYVLLDLKIGKIAHQDLGQMQMYVNCVARAHGKALRKNNFAICCRGARTPACRVESHSTPPRPGAAGVGKSAARKSACATSASHPNVKLFLRRP
jgi:hypothetical protein